MTDHMEAREEDEELRRKHERLWNDLSALPEDQAHEWLDEFSSQIQLQQMKDQSYQDLKSTLRSPWLYVSLMIGISIPVLLYVGYIYTSLALE
ncbi:hypothetical protein [Paenibacillus chibensis]|uniref:hypothetical protein n=1 Tax=Paenibacillus chibensis TaxID=59846 RepID=UPI0013E3E2B2|nr:hypothetical protein [Paenibacillus chibensis]MEC0371742.1 hypothetical protein [Paenibacillus chibensis]